MSKFLYPIYKLKTKSYIKWWLYHKKAGGSGVLSEILQGFSFNLENTLNRKFKLFEIEGNSVQDGSPSPDNEVPIESAGDNGSINEKITNADGTEEQDYSIFVQQPFRSIGNVRDKFVKVNGNWFERHFIAEGIFNPYNCGLNGGGTTRLRISMWGYQNLKETSVKSKYFPSINGRWDDNNEIKNAIYGWNSDGVIGVNIDKEIASTLDEFKTWASKVGLNFYYIRKNPLDLPCTSEQIEALENLPSTYKDFTIIQSEDETPAYLKIQYYKEG